MSAFKKKRRLRDLKPKKKAKKKTTFESVVEKVMRIREEEKRNSVKRKKSTSSNTTISSTITSTSISSTTSDQFRPNQRPKRPESVAQRVLRERKEKKISTKVPQTPASQRQRYTYRVLQTIQMKLILLCVWAEPAVLGSTKTALEFKYEI